MKPHWTLVFLLVLTLATGSLYYASAGADAQPQSASAAQAYMQPAQYCVYSYQFLVVKIQATPETAQAGTSIDVVLKVEYIDGTPVTLDPQQGDFFLLGSDYSHVYQKVPLTPTGTPGEYRTSIELASSIPPGTYTLYCVHCSLTDGSGNYSPNSDTSSHETVDTTDVSIVVVGPATATVVTTQPLGGLFSSLIVGLIALILIIILIVALLLRRRSKPK